VSAGLGITAIVILAVTAGVDPAANAALRETFTEFRLGPGLTAKPVLSVAGVQRATETITTGSEVLEREPVMPKLVGVELPAFR
jgi:hypothetical protein